MPARSHLVGSLQDLLGRFHQPGFVVAIGPAPGQQEADAQSIGRLAHRVVDGRVDVDVLVVDHCGRPGAEVLGQSEGGSQTGSSGI